MEMFKKQMLIKIKNIEYSLSLIRKALKKAPIFESQVNPIPDEIPRKLEAKAIRLVENNMNFMPPADINESVSVNISDSI